MWLREKRKGERKTRNVVAARVVERVGGRALDRGPHSILVVFADEQTRQVPEFRHVERCRVQTAELRTEASLIYRQAHQSWSTSPCNGMGVKS